MVLAVSGLVIVAVGLFFAFKTGLIKFEVSVKKDQ